MSTRPIAAPYQVIPNAGATPANSGSMAASIISIATIISNLSLPSYSVSWTGTAPVGNLQVQVSDDYSLNANGTVNNPGTWAVMPLVLNSSIVTSIPVSGNTGNGVIDINGQTSVQAIRLVYNFVSGSGTLTAIYKAKVT